MISPIVMSTFSDFKMIIKDQNSEKKKEFPMSKILLSTLSPYFLNLFEKDKKLNEIEFEFNLKLFELINEYLNSMKLTYNEEDIIKLFLIADKLSLETLKIEIFSTFQSILSLSNFHIFFEEIYQNSFRNPNVKQFFGILNKFVYVEMNEIIHLDDFKDVSDDFIKYYCTKSELKVSEFELCLALFRRDNQTNLKDFIRFGGITGGQWETVQAVTQLTSKPNTNSIARYKNF